MKSGNMKFSENLHTRKVQFYFGEEQLFVANSERLKLLIIALLK